MDRRDFLKAVPAAALGVAAPAIRSAQAQAPTRNETLLLVQEYGPNSLDMQGLGSSQPVNGVALNCYDRLVSFKRQRVDDVTTSFDINALEPELAESWQEASDGMSVTFKLRADARFHSGRSVTARDVKWSLDRAVSIGGFATTQMNAGSLEKPDQFVAVDDKTFRIDFLRRDKLTMPNLAVTIPFVFDSELAIRNSGGDVWAKEYLKNNIAGGGAYKVEAWRPGTETIYVRNDDWKSGPLPRLRRIIARDIPSPSTRRALLERGDADISYGLPPKDFSDLAAAGRIRVSAVPVPNAIWYVALNSANPPFNNVKLRQAVAWAMPYEQIMQASLFGRGVPMFGGPSTPARLTWPVPFPYASNIARARALMAESGVGPFTTSLLFDAGSGTIAEPMAVLVKEALAPLGITVELNKIPGANFRGELNKKTAPMAIYRFGGWLDWPDYFFFWNYHGNNSIFNIPSYQNPAMDRLIDAARFTQDPAVYAQNVRGFLELGMHDVPFIPIAQPFHDVAMQRSIGGYQFWPCREPDFRYLTKG
ncbi:ABC transporter substrate-binding protein [Falsiroseomonas stagni]|uniref:Peptide/nickel transport system substrate-binding protein n=1 Tax=Falsiroseomonas stagni DSM 19981 TaxID=1123062 RepID=A0A1I4DLC0_9PROT|nr:ABC transporter substrate-binding protein [Falsiroseomonas stagni]SFK94448.1 peptide/nickel transport system substrate-binding protein [Falsiroseomonas stagni DSM 19981]